MSKEDPKKTNSNFKLVDDQAKYKEMLEQAKVNQAKDDRAEKRALQEIGLSNADIQEVQDYKKMKKEREMNDAWREHDQRKLGISDEELEEAKKVHALRVFAQELAHEKKREKAKRLLVQVEEKLAEAKDDEEREKLEAMKKKLEAFLTRREMEEKVNLLKERNRKIDGRLEQISSMLELLASIGEGEQGKKESGKDQKKVRMK